VNHPERIVIIGGVAGGASAAARARRISEEAEIILFERGPNISFANCGMPYFLGGTIQERSRLLVQTPQTLGQRFDLDVRVNTEVLAIDREKQEVLAVNRRTGREQREHYDALILSPGAEPIRPNLPGFDDSRVFTLRDLKDMDLIQEAIEKGSRALVVGGGYIGLEMVEALHARGMHVTLVEMRDQVLAAADPEMAELLHEELVRQGVDLRLGTSVASFEGGDCLKANFDDGQSLTVDFAILAIGVRPDVTLARDAGLKLGPKGGIQVDEGMRTSDPAIFAVGDAVEVMDHVTGDPAIIPLAGPANRQGRIAADVIMGRKSAYRSTQGTAIVKVFGLTFAVTGLGETALKARGIPHRHITIHPYDHATYYPGAQALTLKLLFDPGDGHLLGAQAVGANGVDKRIDVLAVALRAGLTVYDLEQLELCYAPPFGSAKDPVNMAGFVAANVLRGDVELWEPEELPLRSDQVLLDVRTLEEFRCGSMEGAQHAPMDELRDRLEDLDQGIEYLVFCQMGMRGYLACRILSQRGYRCRNLSGGLKRWELWKRRQDRRSSLP
jgi:NADPH-dependent 2,4-dienoyl-CoA reductase/sulfur reductase-like enzyme/rhodanese-related sulfurtransferase